MRSIRPWTFSRSKLECLGASSFKTAKWENTPYLQLWAAVIRSSARSIILEIMSCFYYISTHNRILIKHHVMNDWEEVSDHFLARDFHPKVLKLALHLAVNRSRKCSSCILRAYCPNRGSMCPDQINFCAIYDRNNPPLFLSSLSIIIKFHPSI